MYWETDTHTERMFAGQCYQSLRASCPEKGQLFTDPEFSYINADPDVKWKRPPELCQNPKFIDSGARSTDICQGELGDCWLLAAISSLTLHPALLSRVVPEDQTFCPSGGYCGIFHFKLWRFGEWVDVVVDDKLPTKGGRLLYTKSDTRGEMWSTLLEKAYAKVCGGYSALQGGAIPEALEDFTGGVAESVNVTRQSVEEIWELVNQSEGDKALMGCYIEVSEPNDIGRINDKGLVLGHAYSVIGAKKVQSRLGEVLLLHLRNPWGFTEYKGAWSDRSLDWETVSEKERKELNVQKEDGEFWMLCKDFCNIFTLLVLCRINLDSSCWSVTNLSGRWESGVSAGGGRRLKSFFNNPQFRLHIDEVSSPDQKVDPAQGEETYTAQEEDGIKGRQILLQLLQTDPRRDRLHIACHLYKVPESLSLRPRLDRGFFTRSRPVCDTGDPQNSRGVVLRTLMNSGEYVIVPSTHNPNEEGTFLIRVYCEKMGCMKEDCK
ncbi:calpain-1 catalytic subunit-like [Pelobates fuscus]|uniref:calpain-1 catalytic subunit-like n=1 Tax=Pelobates fuscus TaxID=191477 RepID=UPI002FE470AB